MVDLSVSQIIDTQDLMRHCAYCYEYLNDSYSCCGEQRLHQVINIIENTTMPLVINGIIGSEEIKLVLELARECVLRRMCEQHSGVPVEIDTPPK